MSACRNLVWGCLLAMVVPTFAQTEEDEAHKAWIRANYEKYEYRVPVRDGVTLFTSAYIPNWSKGPWPIVLFRTPYGVEPYGLNAYKEKLGPNPAWDKDGFIFVFQDVRGRYMSQGHYLNMRPHKAPGSGGKKAHTNESSDTYDTIEWLLAQLPNHNGRVGQWGISYPGFYTAAGMIDNHPALKVASPQAPIADWFWDDMHHNGAFSLNLAFNFFSSFGVKRKGLVTKAAPRVEHGTPDGYQFFLDLGPLKNVNEKFFHGEIEFWNHMVENPDYSSFWQARNILPHLKNISCAVMTVGGFYDAEDLYGPLNIYREVERNNPGIHNILVMGAWDHGGWARRPGEALGDAHFGYPTSDYYRKHIGLPLFQHYLKDAPKPDLAEATVFEGGANRWRHFDQWPPKKAERKRLYLNGGGGLAFKQVNDQKDYDQYVSDPNNPVPNTAAITTSWGRAFMAEDQRFASRRPDVLTYITEPLEQDLTLAGPLEVDLRVSTDQGDADWVVKLVDMYPGDAPPLVIDEEEIERGHAQLLVRYEIFRGRYRESFEKPKPFTPGEVAKVAFRLQDVMHTFKRGHRVMIQIQSSFFPFFDRNPQRYVPNIFKAEEDDFVVATHRVWHSEKHLSSIEVGILPNADAKKERR